MKKPNEIRKETTFLTDKKGFEKFSKALSLHNNIPIFIKNIKINFPLYSFINICKKGNLIPEESLIFVYNIIVDKNGINIKKKEIVKNKNLITNDKINNITNHKRKENMPIQDMFSNDDNNIQIAERKVNTYRKTNNKIFDDLKIPENQTIVGKKWGIKKNNHLKDKLKKNKEEFYFPKNYNNYEFDDDNLKTEEDKLIISNKKNILQNLNEDFNDKILFNVNPLNLNSDPKIIFKMPENNKYHQNIRYDKSDSSINKSQDEKISFNSNLNTKEKEKEKEKDKEKDNYNNKFLMNQMQSKFNNKIYKRDNSQKGNYDEISHNDKSEFTNNDQRSRTRDFLRPETP